MLHLQKLNCILIFLLKHIEHLIFFIIFWRFQRTDCYPTCPLATTTCLGQVDTIFVAPWMGIQNIASYMRTRALWFCFVDYYFKRIINYYWIWFLCIFYSNHTQPYSVIANWLSLSFSPGLSLFLVLISFMVPICHASSSPFDPVYYCCAHLFQNQVFMFPKQTNLNVVFSVSYYVQIIQFLVIMWLDRVQNHTIV